MVLEIVVSAENTIVAIYLLSKPREPRVYLALETLEKWLFDVG